MISGSLVFHKLSFLDYVLSWPKRRPQRERVAERVIPHGILSIESSGVKIVDEDGEEQILPADDVLLATDMRASNQKYDSWVMLADEVEFIGDCKQSGKIFIAMRTEYCAGATI